MNKSLCHSAEKRSRSYQVILSSRKIRIHDTSMLVSVYTGLWISKTKQKKKKRTFWLNWLRHNKRHWPAKRDAHHHPKILGSFYFSDVIMTNQAEAETCDCRLLDWWFWNRWRASKRWNTKTNIKVKSIARSKQNQERRKKESLRRWNITRNRDEIYTQRHDSQNEPHERGENKHFFPRPFSLIRSRSRFEQ